MEHVILQTFLKRPRYLEGASKVPDEAKIVMLRETFQVQPLNDHRQVTKYGSVHQG